MTQRRRARAEIETLRQEMEDQQDLVQRVEEAEHAARAAEERAARAEASANATVTERGTPIMYVSRERKLPKLRGRPRDDDDCDVIDWLEDIKSSVNARRMSEVERFDFVMEHLAGEAKSEMRLRFRNDRDSEKLLHAIEESYSTTDSTTSLKKEFYRRDQQETESFEEYSLALVRIADRIAQRDSQDEDSLATELKERLTEGVSDCHFRRELHRLSLDEPELTFWSFRARATKWLGDDTTKKGKRVTSVNEVGQTTASLKDKLEKQQAQLDGIEKKLDMLASGQQYQKKRSYWNTQQGVRLCYSCGSPDHMIRDCPTKKTNNQQKGSGQQTMEGPADRKPMGN